MVTNDDELFKAEQRATDSIINTFQELIDRQNKLEERVEHLEQEISHLKKAIVENE
jgi:hypothetical protein